MDLDPTLYEDLFEHALDPVLLTQPGRGVVRANRAALEVLGGTHAEICGRAPGDLVVHDAEYEALLRERDATGGARAVLTMVRLDGRKFRAEVVTNLMRRAPEPLAYVRFRDVTEALATARRFEEARQRYEVIHDHAPFAIALGRVPDGALVTFNEAYRALHGRPAEELVGKNAADLGFATREQHAAFAAELAANGRVRGREIVRQTGSGEERTMLLDLTRVTVQGEPHVLTVALDVTDRARAEEALRTSEARWRLLVTHAPASIAMFDREMRYLAYSRKFQLENDLGDRELLGLSHYEVFPDIPDHWKQVHQRCLGGESARSDDDTKMRADGSMLWVRWEIVPWHDAAGAVGGIILFSENVTAWKQLEAELRRSEAVTRQAMRDLERSWEATRRTEEKLRHAHKMEAVGQLAGGVAHDFNNLLTVILGNAESVASTLSEDDPLREEVLEVERAGQRAAALTRQLLAFSRKQVLAPRLVNLNRLLSELDRMLRRLIGEDIELTMLLDRGAHTCRIDPGQFEQVMINLVVNARDAMPDGGRLTIETCNVMIDADYVAEHPGAQVGGHVRVTVTDTGVGMSPEVRSHIFEPFFTTKEAGRGTGLGLATVHGIVSQSGGNVWVYSEPGQGTTFRLYFPRADGVEDQTPARGAPASRRGTETVLLVEDDDQVRATVATMLRRAGYHVIPAENGGEALLICEQHGGTIHLLLTDVVMPKLNGRKVAERLRVTRPDMKVIFMSGYTENAIVHHGMLDGGVHFLAKPLSNEVLLAKVREVLDGA